MRNQQFAQEPRAYKSLPNMFRYRRPDGTLIATSALLPDDPGIDSSREDARIAEQARKGSDALLSALRAARG